MRRLMLAAALLAACGKPQPEKKTDMALYLEPGRTFSCQAPAQWKVLENQGGAQRVTFLGPADGPAPFSASISVYYYPKVGGTFATPQDYARAQGLTGKTGPLIFKTWKGMAVFEFSATRVRPVLHGAGQTETRKEQTVLIPAPEGFYAVVYSASDSGFTQTEPLFRSVVDSLSFGQGKQP